MIPETLRRLLEARRIKYHVHSHEQRFTAQEIAHVAHLSGKRFAKSVLLRTHGGPPWVLAVLPATEQVDLGRLGRQIGFPVEMAGEEAFQRLFPQFEPGAAPPIADLAAEQLPVYVDECLSRGDAIAFNAGTHTDVVEMPWPEFVRLASPVVMEYGRQPLPPGLETRP